MSALKKQANSGTHHKQATTHMQSTGPWKGCALYGSACQVLSNHWLLPLFTITSAQGLAFPLLLLHTGQCLCTKSTAPSAAAAAAKSCPPFRCRPFPRKAVGTTLPLMGNRPTPSLPPCLPPLLLPIHPPTLKLAVVVLAAVAGLWRVLVVGQIHVQHQTLTGGIL